MPYATTDDLAKRWRELTDEEAEVAETYLSDAENMLKRLIPNFEMKVIDETFKEVLIAIECGMVKRALMNNLDQLGVSQHTITAGSYNENITYANPSGDMYLTKNEKRLLGISQQRIGAIMPLVGGSDD